MNSESEPDICDWEVKYNKQREFTDRLITLFYSMKSKRNNVFPAVDEFEENNECDNINQCKYKTELEEKKITIKELTADLKCKEDELCNARKQLNDLCSRSREMELYGIKSKEMKDKLKREQEILSVKFKTVCKKLYETNVAFNEAKSIIKNNVLHIYNTASAISEVTEETEQKKISLEIQKLKDEKLYYMTRKIKELQQENDCNVLKINKQKKQLQEFRDKYMQNHDCFCLEKKFCNILQTVANKSNGVIKLNK